MCTILALRYIIQNFKGTVTVILIKFACNFCVASEIDSLFRFKEYHELQSAIYRGKLRFVIMIMRVLTQEVKKDIKKKK